MHVIFATYLQNVITTLPCKMANEQCSLGANLEFCKSRGQTLHIDKHVHRIVNCIEQLTVN